MIFSEHAPSYLLSPYIKTYWFLEGNLPVEALQPERIFPDGCMELIIHYGQPFQQVSGHIAEKQANGFVFGQLEQYIELLPSAIAGVMGVKFFPEGLSHFTTVPVHEIKQQAVELRHIFKNGNDQLVSEISEAKNFMDKSRLMDQFLVKHMLPSKRHQSLAHGLLRDIYASNGSVAVAGLVRKYHMSERQLERVFAQEIGLSPKNFSRIKRFQQVFKMAGSAGSLTRLALDAGYFDQAHFSREFKAFTGLSPRQYFSGRFEFATLFLDD